MKKIIVFTGLTIVMGIGNMFATTLIDTIIAPPTSPSLISGSSLSCVGDTSIYISDVPLSCEANWYINGVLQSTPTGMLDIIWTTSGSKKIILEFDCDTTYVSDSLLVVVGDLPNSPLPIIGEDNVCLGMTSYYSTEVNQGDSCQWKVDGVLQMSNSTELYHYWDEIGIHNIEVNAFNECGISNKEELEVEVFELAVVELGNDTSIIVGQSIILNAENFGSSFLWTTGDTTQTILVDQTGNYGVMVSNPCGEVWDEIFVDVMVGEQELAANNIVVNVVGDYLNISIKGENTQNIQIFDMAGKLLKIHEVGSQIYFPHKGMFIAIILTSQNNIYTCKVLK